MGCGCKSNAGATKKVNQVTKRSTIPTTHSVSSSTPQQKRKNIIIRRPAK